MKKTSSCTHRARILVEKMDSGRTLCVEEWLLFTELGKMVGGRRSVEEDQEFYFAPLKFEMLVRCLRRDVK